MSDFGSLSQCMVDSDASAKTRAKRLRRKALAISLILEGTIIAVVLLLPLATLGVLPPQEFVVPVPRFHVEQTQPQILEHPHAVSNRPTFGVRLLQPTRIPTHVFDGPDMEPPTVGDPLDVVPGVPGGSGDGPSPIQVVQPPRPQVRTVRKSGEMMEAMLIHRIDPEYPRVATTIHLSGTVILRARIGTDGEVHELEMVSGNQILADAARKAVMQWRYRPTMLNGQAVEVETQITVKFVLNGE